MSALSDVISWQIYVQLVGKHGISHILDQREQELDGALFSRGGPHIINKTYHHSVVVFHGTLKVLVDLADVMIPF